MTPELTALALAGLLLVAQYALFAIPANLQLGLGYTTSPRDRPPSRPLSPAVARLQRALDNHFQGLIFFTLAVCVVTLSGQSTALTAACGWVYLAARFLYVPAYAAGLRPWRSLLWLVGFFATALMLLTTLF